MSDTPKLAAALVEALSDLIVVEQGRTAKIPTKDGKNYTYKYADIGDVVKLTRPALKAHGIVALTPVHDHGNGLACTVILLHTSGERLDLGPFPFPPGKDAQTTGSAVTYHRRYALVAALGMAAGEDDDGRAASAPQDVPVIAEALVDRVAAFPVAVADDALERIAKRSGLPINGLPALRGLPAEWEAYVTGLLDHLEREQAGEVSSS